MINDLMVNDKYNAVIAGLTRNLLKNGILGKPSEQSSITDFRQNDEQNRRHCGLDPQSGNEK
jgi:hypothetical protein